MNRDELLLKILDNFNSSDNISTRDLIMLMEYKVGEDNEFEDMQNENFLINTINLYKDLSNDYEKQCNIYKTRIDKLKEYINNLYDDEYISYGTKEEMLKIIEGEDNEV